MHTFSDSTVKSTHNCFHVQSNYTKLIETPCSTVLYTSTSQHETSAESDFLKRRGILRAIAKQQGLVTENTLDRKYIGIPTKHTGLLVRKIVYASMLNSQATIFSIVVQNKPRWF